MTVFEMIEAQQKGKENTPAWMVGEQLKDICRNEPASAELVAQDLSNTGMGIAECEKKIKKYADAHRKDNSYCVIPTVAEDIIRKFYGLPERGAASVPAPAPANEALPILNMADFF